MTLKKHFVAAVTALSLVSSPALAAGNATSAPLREASQTTESEQLFGADGSGWLIFLLLAAVVAAVVIVGHNDTPASP